MRIGRLFIGWKHLDAAWATDWWPNGMVKQERTLFSLRCHLCFRPSLGCREHWFCGSCEPCRKAWDASFFARRQAIRREREREE